MIKYMLLIFILTNTAFCDFSLTAKEAMRRTNETLKGQKTQCVKDWEREIEDQIALTINIGDCSCIFSVQQCVSKNFLHSALRTFKKLGYRVRKLDRTDALPNDRDYSVSWCRK